MVMLWSLSYITLSVALKAAVDGPKFPKTAEDNNHFQQVYEATVPPPKYQNLCASSVLVNQSFANSYGHPATISYNPPENCTSFTHVVAELHITIFDHQYDRLMHLIKDDIEVWRPSTPEPVGHKVYTELDKDLSHFANLFKTPGNVSFCLDNIISQQNDGVYHVELILNFFEDHTAQHIMSDSNWYYEPDFPPTNFFPVIPNDVLIAEKAASGKLPKLSRNTTRAVLNVHASGNSNEEFWYAGDLSSNGATRLIEVFVDGQLAGVIDPFPVVYTGGISPALWHPLMGIKASDVPSYTVDVTPFLPLFWEKHDVVVEIAVGNGYSPSPESILSNWIIDVSLLTWETPHIVGEGTMNAAKNSSYGYPMNLTNSEMEVIQARYYKQICNTAELRFSNTTSRTNYSGTWYSLQRASMFNYLAENNYFQSVNQLGDGCSKYGWTPSEEPETQGHYFLQYPVEYTRVHSYPLQLVESANSTGSVNLLSILRAFNVNATNGANSLNQLITQQSYFTNHQWVSETNVTSGDFTRHVVANNNEIVVDTFVSGSTEQKNRCQFFQLH